MNKEKGKAWESITTILANLQADLLRLRKYQNAIFEEEGIH